MKRTFEPLKQIVLARLREFVREPAAVFWVYGFPLIMIVALGIAFRSKPLESVAVTIEDGPEAATMLEALGDETRFRATIEPVDEAKRLLRISKTDVVIRATSSGSATTDSDSIAPQDDEDDRESKVEGSFAQTAQQGSDATDTATLPSGLQLEYQYDPTKPGSVLARNAVDDQLQRAAGRTDVLKTREIELSEPGSRYVDFLVPGLIGLSLMGGGMWGVGYAIVDLRIRKLLKRFLATPMKRSHFLAGMMISRLFFMLPEFILLLVFARFVFGVQSYGGYLPLIFLILLGAVEFAGIGLLVASRASTIETVSGLMNLVMLPMWILSGVFFSNDRFPAAVQPLIQALPLTALNNALRGVMLEGATLGALLPEIGIISAWAVGSFVLALYLFRWK